MKSVRNLLAIIAAVASFSAAAQTDADDDERKRVALDEQLKVMKRNALCVHFGMFIRGEELRIMPSYSRRDEVLKKAFGRLGVAAANESRIRNKSLVIGMTECELLAARGFPQLVNESVGAGGVMEQHVYGELGPYVYIRNGRVTGWQDTR